MRISAINIETNKRENYWELTNFPLSKRIVFAIKVLFNKDIKIKGEVTIENNK